MKLFEILSDDAGLLAISEQYGLGNDAFCGCVKTVSVAVRAIHNAFSHNGFATFADLVAFCVGGDFAGFFGAFFQGHDC